MFDLCNEEENSSSSAQINKQGWCDLLLKNDNFFFVAKLARCTPHKH